MASQSQIEDEILAKRLQEEGIGLIYPNDVFLIINLEYAEQRRHEQLRQDHALARYLDVILLVYSKSFRQMSTNQYAIQAGQSVSYLDVS